MIEMQWVKAPLNTADNVVVFPAGNQVNWLYHKLQFREVVRRAPELGASIITATDWQDVKLASAEGGK